MQIEQVEFLGIVFRAVPHLYWFAITLVIFAASVIVVLIIAADGSLYGPVQLWGFLAAGYLCTVFVCGSETNWGEINGPVYSIDCIWFNALIALLYLVAAISYYSLYQLLSHWSNRSPAQP